MGTRTGYVSIYKPSDSEVFDEQLNDNANSDLIDAQILTEHNLILAHTGAPSPHSGHAVLAGPNVLQGLQTVQVSADSSALMLDTPSLVAPGALTGSRQVLRARSFDSAPHTRDFLWRARAQTNAGAGIIELLTSLDGGAPTVLWSVNSAGIASGAGNVPPMESLFGGTVLNTAASVDLSQPQYANALYVFPTANGLTITLPDARTTNRPITIYGPPTAGWQVTLASIFGAISGGSANLTTGTIQNGTVVSGDSFLYKADGASWKS